MTKYERDDLIHIMKMNRFALEESDSAHLRFLGQSGDTNYEVTVTTVEHLPNMAIKQGKRIIFQETLPSVDDLKIFLDERLYQYLGENEI